MKYFKYINGIQTRSLSDMYDIYQTVQKLDRYAKKIYKNRWEDALDMAFFHVLQNYDSSKGELENYTIKVVSGVLLNQFKKEYPYEFIADLGLNEEPKTEFEDTDIVVNPEQKVDVNGCIAYLAPLFVRDFRFFDTMNGQHRKEDYSNLFEMYSYKTVQNAISYLTENYSERVREVYTSKKKCGGKSSNKESSKNQDSNLVYVNEITDIIVYYKKKKNSYTRYIYSVDLKKAVSELLLRFYSGDATKAHAKVENADIYCSITGKLVYSQKDLFDALVYDIVGIILARTSLKLMKLKGYDEAIFVSTSELKYDLNLTIFGESTWITIDQRSAKEIANGGKHA